jgi:hypothetical protein
MSDDFSANQGSQSACTLARPAASYTSTACRSGSVLKTLFAYDAARGPNVWVWEPFSVEAKLRM